MTDQKFRTSRPKMVRLQSGALAGSLSSSAMTTRRPLLFTPKRRPTTSMITHLSCHPTEPYHLS